MLCRYKGTVSVISSGTLHAKMAIPDLQRGTLETSI